MYGDVFVLMLYYLLRVLDDVKKFKFVVLSYFAHYELRK